MFGTHPLIQDGDNVIFFEGFSKMTPCKVARGGSFNCRFGLFPHDTLIGLPFGSKVYPRGKASGYLYVLRLTPEYWTAAVTHRTQILYHADCSMIVFGLRLKPGKISVESGTGSGSLTTSLARAIAPHGHIHTFEFNPRRMEAARDEFKTNGLSELVTCYQRDVCANGFPLVSGGVDAVFLDLPTPWQVVVSSKKILRPEGRLCSFSPCIEQVQKMCSALSREGFQDIRTVECLLKTYQVFTHEYPEFVSEPSHSNYYEKEPEVEEKGGGIGEEGGGGENVWEDDGEGGERQQESGSEKGEKRSEKKQKSSGGKNKGKRKHEDSVVAPKTTKKLLCRPFHEMRGHTGYLTFAGAPVADDESQASVPGVSSANQESTTS
jgi:tRNA (adenine57-N1/adenine58-N1)-methyltransferase